MCHFSGDYGHCSVARGDVFGNFLFPELESHLAPPSQALEPGYEDGGWRQLTRCVQSRSRRLCQSPIRLNCVSRNHAKRGYPSTNRVKAAPPLPSTSRQCTLSVVMTPCIPSINNETRLPAGLPDAAAPVSTLSAAAAATGVLGVETILSPTGGKGETEPLPSTVDLLIMDWSSGDSNKTPEQIFFTPVSFLARISLLLILRPQSWKLKMPKYNQKTMCN